MNNNIMNKCSKIPGVCNTSISEITVATSTILAATEFHGFLFAHYDVTPP